MRTDRTLFRRLVTTRTLTAAAAILLAAWASKVAWGEPELSEPVYRVARDATTPAKQVSVAQADKPAESPFDLTLQQGEHPLMPVIRVGKEVIAHIDNNVQDYSCVLEKRERLDGSLGDKQVIQMNVREQPFSVYMKFHQPHQGREVIFVNGQNNNEMLVLEAGFKRRLGQMSLDPNGWLAMRGQKYPITKIGIRNLMAEVVKFAEADTKYSECEVKTDPNTNIDGRPTTMIQIEHPVPRREFRSYVTRIFLDNELKVPIHCDSYMWPEVQGKAPPLEKSYTYRNLKVNVGLTPNDFDPKNPEIFN